MFHKRHYRKSHKRKWIITTVLFALIATIGISVVSIQQNDTRTSTPEVTLEHISLHVPDLTGWFGGPSFDSPEFEGYISVTVIPNDKTIPNYLYQVDLFYEEQLIRTGMVSWSPDVFVKGFIGGVNYKGNTKVFHFPISKSHRLYKIYWEQYSKPVSERHFTIQDYVEVSIIKQENK